MPEDERMVEIEIIGTFSEFVKARRQDRYRFAIDRQRVCIHGPENALKFALFPGVAET